MMRQMTRLMGLSAMFVAIAGCNRTEQDRIVENFSELDSGSAIMTVNGIRYTRGDFDRDAALDAAIVDLMLQGASAGAVSKREKILEEMSDKRLAAKVLEIVVNQAAKEAGIGVSASDLEEKLRESIKRFSRGKFDQAAFDSHLAKSGLDGCFSKKIRAQAIQSTYYDHLFTNNIHITESYVNNYITYYNRQREVALATNVLIYAMASNVCSRARAGEDFLALYKTYTNVIQQERKDEGESLECDSFSFASQPEVWERVSQLKDGEVSDVIEMEDCLVIYKAIRHIIKEGGNEKILLSRIRIRRAVVPVVPDEDEAGKKVHDAFYADMVQRENARLIKSAQIAFPCGMRFLSENCLSALREYGVKMEDK